MEAQSNGDRKFKQYISWIKLWPYWKWLLFDVRFFLQVLTWIQDLNPEQSPGQEYDVPGSNLLNSLHANIPLFSFFFPPFSFKTDLWIVCNILSKLISSMRTNKKFSTLLVNPDLINSRHKNNWLRNFLLFSQNTIIDDASATLKLSLV